MLLGFGLCGRAEQQATVRIDGSMKYQKITGFGGFVCSASFGYNYMSTSEIKKLWGRDSQAGYNIMRLYIPIGKSAWGASLATAKLAKSMGLIVFASPWSMPSEWKTNNATGAVSTDSSGSTQVGYLKEANYADYADYLNEYVGYLKDNGVALDAISIQNEPDMRASYAGCIWTPAQMSTFIKNYASRIQCKIIAPESIGLSDSYANGLWNDDVIAHLDIYAGHQYGNIESAYKQYQTRGKEVWMTEFLINWNSAEMLNGAKPRNFKWSSDAFDFAESVNNALLGNVNAWIHYASKRFYGMMGDGTYGTTNGVMTKRGYILSHFAKYATGGTRVKATWKDDASNLQGSAYLSQTGDSAVLMIINPSDETYNLTVDIPFYTSWGKCVVTTEKSSMDSTVLNLGAETCRPKVTVEASSMTTLIFRKSSNREPSNMTGSELHANTMEGQIVTNSAFGTRYKMSGKKVTFDHSNNLISSNTTADNGYLKLNDSYNKLVMHVIGVSSTMNYSSANTTLYYINSKGAVNSHNYGNIDLNRNGNFDWTFDLSASTLNDGCKGVIGITNNNWTSVLTLQLGDVYFKMGNEKMFTFGGTFSKDDSNLLDCLEDTAYTWLDMSGVQAVKGTEGWRDASANKNCLLAVNDTLTLCGPNVVCGDLCQDLTLEGNSETSSFCLLRSIQATKARFTRTFSEYGLLTLPFPSALPQGLKAYRLTYDATSVVCTQMESDTLPANTPLLIKGSGTYSFEGSGEVSVPTFLNVGGLQCVYCSTEAPIGSYYLQVINGEPVFTRCAEGHAATMTPFTAYLTASSSAATIPVIFNGSDDIRTAETSENQHVTKTAYDLLGRPAGKSFRGIVLTQGHKSVRK
jgi:glucuronoarabinoxylan endo-1,4-beta-xylanase